MSDPWPTAIIGGAQRSGTTALFNMLAHHPDVFVPLRKEPHYFACAGAPPPFTGPGDDAFVRDVVVPDRGRYLELFDRGRESRHRIEGSALYLGYPGTAERVARAIPHVRLVFILRDPVMRAYSAHQLMRREERDPLARFVDALAAEPDRTRAGWSPAFWYVSLSRYGTNLGEWYERFPRDQILVCVYEDFERDPLGVLRRVEAHLGLAPLSGYPIETRYQVSGTPRSRVLHRALHGTSALKRATKRVAPMRLRRAVMRMRAANLKRPEPLDPDLEERLGAELAGEVRATIDLTGIDVQGKWSTPP